MTRIITIEDDEGGPATRLIIRHNAIAEITIGSNAIDGLPEEVIRALLPFVGLPGVRARPASTTNGTPPVQKPAPRAVPREKARAAITPTRVAVAPPAFTPPAPAPAPAPAPPEKPAPMTPEPDAAPETPHRRSSAKYPRPSHAELRKAMKELKTASPSRLGEHFDVPSYIVSNWLTILRKSEKEQGS